MDIADVSRVPTDVLCNVEADTYWCMSKLLDGIQVSWGRRGSPPRPESESAPGPQLGRFLQPEWCTAQGDDVGSPMCTCACCRWPWRPPWCPAEGSSGVGLGRRVWSPHVLLPWSARGSKGLLSCVAGLLAGSAPQKASDLGPQHLQQQGLYPEGPLPLRPGPGL